MTGTTPTLRAGPGLQGQGYIELMTTRAASPPWLLRSQAWTNTHQAMCLTGRRNQVLRAIGLQASIIVPSKSGDRRTTRKRDGIILSFHNCWATAHLKGRELVGRLSLTSSMLSHRCGKLFLDQIWNAKVLSIILVSTGDLDTAWPRSIRNYIRRSISQGNVSLPTSTESSDHEWSVDFFILVRPSIRAPEPKHGRWTLSNAHTNMMCTWVRTMVSMRQMWRVENNAMRGMSPDFRHGVVEQFGTFGHGTISLHTQASSWTLTDVRENEHHRLAGCGFAKIGHTLRSSSEPGFDWDLKS